MNEFLLQDIAEWLASESIDLTHGVSLFSGRLPDSDVNAVALLHYGSRGSVNVMDTEDNAAVADKPLVQAFTRYREMSDEPEGMRVALAVHASMLRLHGETVGHHRFIAVTPVSGVPFYVGDNESGAQLYSCNYEVEVESA